MQSSPNSASELLARNKNEGTKVRDKAPLSATASAIINTFRRLEKGRNLKRLNAYLGSQSYKEAHARLPLHEVVKVSTILAEVHGRLWRPERIRKAGSVRVRWTEEYTATFLATWRALGDDIAVAHRLKLPLDTVRRARLRLLGRIEAPSIVADAA